MRTQPRVTEIARRVLALSVLIGILFVIGCGGSGTQNSSSAPVTYTIGGTVSGLSGTGLVLENNDGNNLPVSAGATSFTFITAIASGSTFNVTVFSQPSDPAQTCVVASGNGTDTANVTDIQVTCTTNTYTIGGTVSGLSGTGLVLENNDGNNLPVSAGATSFTFITAIASGSTFNVTVFSQPSSPAQTCGVTAGGSGTVASANITSVVVACNNSELFELTGNMTAAREGHSATLLNNGKVLIAGGTSAGGNNLGLASAELYNPATGSFTATASMASRREYHTATLLNNAMVLIAGGVYANGYLASAELYDSATGTFAATGNMTSARFSHTATLLNNGIVLIAGGNDGTPVASAELYNPATGSFTATGSMTTARYYDTATLLNNGMVLIAGGVNTAGVLPSAELYDPATGTFTATGSMTTARYYHTATLLNNAMVLIAGGNNGNNTSLSSAELYDPATGTFTLTTGSLNTARYAQTGTLLNNGNVLVAGGGGSSGTPLVSAELYLPGTLTPTGLVSIKVTPATPTLSVGSTQQFIATGTFSDGSMQNLQSVTWGSSNQAASTITNDASDHGVALALAAGQSTITASAGSISGSTVLTVQ